MNGTMLCYFTQSTDDRQTGNVPSFYFKIWPKLFNPFKGTDFQSIFARSASAVTPKTKKVRLSRTRVGL